MLDLRYSNTDDPEEAARRLGGEFLSETVDLREGPLFDARLLRLSDDDHVLILTLDHIVSDATSYPILTREIISLLTGHPGTTNEPLPELKIQFPDYAVWQQRTSEEWRHSHEPYWRAKLSKLPPLIIPPDNNSHNHTQLSSAVIHIPIGKQLTDKLRDIARRERCLMPLIVLALYLVAMSRWCNQHDLLVTFVSNGRHWRPDLRDMIGCIAYPTFLRVEIGRNDSLRDLVARVSTEFHSSLAHDASRLPATDITSNDPTEISFNWLPSEWGLSGTHPSAIRKADDSESGLRIQRFPIGQKLLTKFAPYFTDSPSGILIVIWYDDHLFLRQTVERFAAELRHAAATFVQTPNAPVGSLI